MTIPQNIVPPQEMLAQLHKLLRWTAFELTQRVNDLTDGAPFDAKDAGHTIRELRQTLNLALDESKNVEKIANTFAAASEGYDLDAARDEIGRRLSKLRAARDDGRILGQSE